MYWVHDWHRFLLFQRWGQNTLLLDAWVPYIQIASVWLKHKVSSLTAKGQWSVEAVPYTNIDFILAGFPAHWLAAILQGSRQFHVCSQVSSQTTAAQLLSSFFLTDLISATLSKIPIHLVLRVWVDANDVLRKPCHGFIAPTISWNNITTVWANVISNLPSHVSPTKITRVTSQRAHQSDCCSRTEDATVQHRSCSNT